MQINNDKFYRLRDSMGMSISEVYMESIKRSSIISQPLYIRSSLLLLFLQIVLYFYPFLSKLWHEWRSVVIWWPPVTGLVRLTISFGNNTDPSPVLRSICNLDGCYHSPHGCDRHYLTKIPGRALVRLPSDALTGFSLSRLKSGGVVGRLFRSYSRSLLRVATSPPSSVLCSRGSLQV